MALNPSPRPPGSELATTPYTKHAEFWLHDGSIVLHVQSTLFKVHQTILANHSEIFADLFSLPQPQDDGYREVEQMDGCPLVQLHDSVDDFVDLLKAIYYPSHFDTLSSTADLDDLLTFVGGILRLSTKYIIRELRKRCITLLTGRFPTTYQEYLARSTSLRAHILTTSTFPHPPAVDLTALANLITLTLMPSTSGSNVPPNPVMASQPAAPSAPAPLLQTQPSVSTLSLNPSVSNTQSLTTNSLAHPHTSRPHSHSHRPKTKPKLKPEPTPPKPKVSSVMRAISLAHQTNTHLILPYAYYLLARTSSPRRFLSHSSSPISWHQKTICLIGRTLLHSAEISMSHAFLVAFQVASRCMSPTQCAASRGPLVEWALLQASGKGPEPLKPWDRWDKLGVCGECVEEAKRKHERGREEVWERLPGFFDLDCWEELREMQNR